MYGARNCVKPFVSGDEDYISLHAHDTMLQDSSPAQETLQVLRVVQVPNKQLGESIPLKTEDNNGDISSPFLLVWVVYVV